MDGFEDGDGGVGEEDMEDGVDVSWRGGEEEKDYDRDPEFADVLGSCLDDPDRARSQMEEILRKKRNKILHTKTGSPNPMLVKFNNDASLNKLVNRQFGHGISLDGLVDLSQYLLDKRPSYDAIQGANVTPATFYNTGDLEVQDNLARIWVDISTSEPLLLDILINALTQSSSD